MTTVEIQHPPLLLTFEKLVAETARKIAANGGKSDADMVRHVLQDAGVDEFLRQAAPNPKGRLLVHRIKISGEKRKSESTASKRFEYTRQLGTGLWAWVGANGSGKSTILNSIVWALTGADSGISKRVRGWLQDVVVWFSIGDEQYTSRVNRNGETITGGVFRGFQEADTLDLGFAENVVRFRSREEMRESLDWFFMGQLGISSVRWTAHSPQKDDPDLHAHATTWRTYAHAIHIEDDGYDDLIIDAQKGYGRQDRKILEMMLGVDHARAVAEIQVQADFAKEAYGRARSRVSGKESNIADQLSMLEGEKADLERAIELMKNEPTPVEDDSALVAVREKRAVLLAEQNEYSEEIATLANQRAEVQRDILAAEREKVAIQEQSEVKYLVNSLAVVRCPHCESTVDLPERLQRERDTHVCYVCSQPLQASRVGTGGDMKAILAERDQEIAALKQALKNIEAQMVARDEGLNKHKEEIAKLGKALQESVSQARRGFTASYENLLVRKGQIEGNLEQLRRSAASIEDEQKEVETAAVWHQILQTAAEIADESVFNMYQNVYGALGQLVVRLAADFGLPDLEQVTIDEKRYVRLVQGGVTITHNDLARSERVKFKVAFHLALMLIQVRAGLGKHPGFLIIDTPGTAEVDPSDLVAMVRDLANIYDEYGDRVQVLLATAREEALAHLPTALIQRPGQDEVFF
jgi:energy-coupling factor transporter ATP-binding protein EcfA2